MQLGLATHPAEACTDWRGYVLHLGREQDPIKSVEIDARCPSRQLAKPLALEEATQLMDMKVAQLADAVLLV
jgi:hypothetical protein